jgi:hypothetical protein
MYSSVNPCKVKFNAMSKGRELGKMKINQFDSEQFLKKMGERLEWAPNCCDIGNRRGGDRWN